MIYEKELLSMKLVHYFIINEGYNPIIIKGINDEVWLENKKNSYSIVRIVTKHIHNKEQYDYDIVKTKHISKQIKRKIFDFSMNVLSIYLDSEYVDNETKFVSICVNNDKDFKENEFIKKAYKNVDKYKYEKKGFDLLSELTMDISNNNIKENEKREQIMKNNKPIITISLIAINIIVFALMYILGNGSENTNTLINFGANFVHLTRAGDYYRLITSAFLHIGIIHLFLNMYSLYILGPAVESFYGRFKYILIYLLSAIFGSLFTVVLSSQNTVAAGASGAIFGLLGALLYFGYNYRGYIGNSIISQIVPIVLINLIFGFMTPGIGNAAHIGGLIGGYLISMAVGFDKESKSSKINGTIISIILLVFLIYLGFIR